MPEPDYKDDLVFPPEEEIKMKEDLCENCAFKNKCEKHKHCTELEKKLEIVVSAFTEIELYRYDVDDIDQEDWFKIATYMAEIAEKALAKIKEIK